MATMVNKKNKVSTAAAGLRAFFNIAKLWRLAVEEQKMLLGLTSDSTLHKWKSDPDSAKLDKDKLDRLSYILGIYKDLQTLLPDIKLADQWIRVPNKASLFVGRPPIEIMKQGRMIDLHQVRQYLALSRGV